MINRGFTTVVALFTSAAICLQPRVALAEISSSDLTVIENQLFNINEVLTNPNPGYGISPMLYDNFVHFYRDLYSDTGVDLSHGSRLDNKTGLLRFLWENVKTGWAVTNIFGNEEAYYLSTGDKWSVWDYEYENSDYEIKSFREFLSLTLGQNFDARPGWEVETEGREAFSNVWDHAFTGDSMGWQVGPGLSSAQFWNGWQAEAWRRQLGWSSNSVDLLRMNVSNSAAWTDTNTRDETNIWKDVVISSTNSVGQGASPPEYYHNPTNAVSWFGNDGDASVKALLPSLDWEIEGQANEVRLFGFDELDKKLSGVLAVDFTSSPWTDMRGIMQFVIAVSTCVVLVMIVRSEVNFWTTLGGSST